VALNDAAIVARVLAGDSDAYRVLVERYRAEFGRYAVAVLGDSDAAADAIQEAFIRAYDGLASCREPERFGSWFFRILQNQCRNALARVRKTVDVADADPASPHRTDALVEQAELAAVLETALGALTAEQREALVLKHVEGRSYEEMSQLLGVGVDALKMRVHRARDALREILGGRL
jgi:RNA polymerase sigma-70 factor (ECF subfamily)